MNWIDWRYLSHISKWYSDWLTVVRTGEKRHNESAQPRSVLRCGGALQVEVALNHIADREYDENALREPINWSFIMPFFCAVVLGPCTSMHRAMSWTGNDVLFSYDMCMFAGIVMYCGTMLLWNRENWKFCRLLTCNGLLLPLTIKWLSVMCYRLCSLYFICSRLWNIQPEPSQYGGEWLGSKVVAGWGR